MECEDEDPKNAEEEDNAEVEEEHKTENVQGNDKNANVTVWVYWTTQPILKIT